MQYFHNFEIHFVDLKNIELFTKLCDLQHYDCTFTWRFYEVTKYEVSL